MGDEKMEKVAKAKKSKRLTEEEILAKYPNVVKGSLHFEESGAHMGKQTVEIRCAEQGCQNRRRVATSDLWQVKKCVEHATADKKAKRAATRKASKPEKVEGEAKPASPAGVVIPGARKA